MKTWEQAEFEEQQEAIREWAAKKFWKTLEKRRLKRKFKKLRKLAEISTSDDRTVVDISICKDKILIQYGYGINKTYRCGSVRLK